MAFEWNPKNNNYVGCGISEVKTKMTSLLSSYRRERAKEKNSMITGSGRGQLYVSTWFAYKLFTLLKEKDAPTNTLDEESISDGKTPESVEENDAEAEIHKNTQQRSSLKRPKSTGGRARQYNTPILKEAVAVMRDIQSKRSQARDEYEVFGELVAHKLRKLSNQRAKSVVQHLICNTLFDAEMGKFDLPPVPYEQSFSLQHGNFPHSAQKLQQVGLHQPSTSHYEAISSRRLNDCISPTTMSSSSDVEATESGFEDIDRILHNFK